MTPLDLLKDPNIHKFLMPLGVGLLTIVSSWAVNQLPSLKNGAQGCRVLKLTVEVAILIVFLAAMPDALEVVKSTEKAVQLAGAVYILVTLGLVVAIGVDFWLLLRKKPSATEPSPEQTLLFKNRQTLMDKVRGKAQGVLNDSLYKSARMDLGLQDCPEMLGLQWQAAGQPRKSLPKGTRLFDQLTELGGGGTLLILGEPGAGKTTLLMELAKDLLDCTNAQQEAQSIPVTLNLSSWGTYRLPNQKSFTFADWLVEELFRQYQLRRQIGRAHV